MSRFSLHRVGVVAIAAALAVTGCSSKADSGGDTSTGEVKTGPGVTANTITLGALTDLSGVFGAQGKILIQGNQLYIDKVNAEGGVCGRQIELVVKDHGYDVQKAVSMFAETEPNVLGYVQLLGSPMLSALGPDIAKTKTLALTAAWSSSLLQNPYMIVPGTTYDVETVNGVEWLAKEKGLKAGDVVGHIYFEGSFGENALEGSQFAADKLGLKIEGIKVKPTDADLTAQVTTLKAHGAKAILLSVGPRQTASVAGVAKSIGYDVPLVGNTPAFDPSLMKTPVAGALASNLWVLASYAPFSADAVAPKEAAAAMTSKYPDAEPNGSVDFGYLAGSIFTNVLKKACENGDLSRDGVAAALRQLDKVDTEGLSPVLDYTDPTKAPTRETYVLKVSETEPGALTTVAGPSEGDLAKSYS